MNPLPALLFVLLSIQCSFALDLATIQSRISQNTGPDTADYKITTTIQMAGQSVVSHAHVIQAGPNMQWYETQMGASTIRMIRNGKKMRSIDLSTGKDLTKQLPVADPASSKIGQVFASGHWQAPEMIGAGLWEAKDTLPSDSSIVRQIVQYSESANQILSFMKILRTGDTTAMNLSWDTQGGHQIPLALDMRTTVGGKISVIHTQYSQWNFPRSIPSTLFFVP